MMWQRRLLLLVTTISASIYTSHGCTIHGVGSWFVPVFENVEDVHRGIFFSNSTENILGINSITFGEGLNGGPYVTLAHSDSEFTISTNDAFPDYERNEVSDTISVTVVFACSAGAATGTLVFQITVIDTNNNAPEFIPTDVFEFTLTPPLPPEFQITGCLHDIIVRDIDLSTQEIIFSIEDNPYFDIDFDRVLTVPFSKEFKAILKTKTLIRTIPEVIELRISATDVDLTPDDPLTRYATLRIKGDDEFELPAEPIFAQSFYLAEYTASHEVILQEPISLQQGYHENVTYTLEGDYSENFALDGDGNELSLDVVTPLSDDTIRTGQIFLVVRAEREFTSGATTTVVLQLPEIPGLEFEQENYEGTIVDNILDPLQLTLSQGYEDDVSVTILGDYLSFFTATVQENIITVTMTLLDESIINENNFINLRVVASTEHSTASTIVTLDIVNDDNVTPSFGSAVYTGTYDMQTGLSHEEITLVQGYDDTVVFTLEGEHANYFQMNHDGPVLTLTSSTLPPDILSEQHLLLTVLAAKSRTVGANAAVSITLPSARVLGFEESTYSGTLQDDVLTLQTIVLNVGYADDVVFELTGEFATSFSTSNIENQVTLNLMTPLPESVILENNFIMLTLSARGEHALATSTNVLLEILKEDVTTPVFSQRIYSGSYSGTANIDINNISLLQGFDSSVTFRLDGEHSQYFGINNIENNVAIFRSDLPIPEELIFNEKVLVFSILADKPLTVGANAAIAITFPPELTEPTAMRFSQNTYIGSIEDDLLTLDNIVLETGFASGTEFILTGDFASYFTYDSSENIVTVSMVNSLPDEIKDDNNFIVLELEAQRDRAVFVSTSIVIDLIEQDIEHPIFGEAYYRGVYTAETGLEFDEVISLSQGYDETVIFGLEGAHATWFLISVNGNSVGLTVIDTIPEEVLLNNNQLLFTVVANKPETLGARAAISIDLPKEFPEPIIIRFAQSSYVGSIDNGEFEAPTITLLGTYTDLLHLDITGDYSDYFELSRESNNVAIDLVNPLPLEVIEENTFIILDIEASYPDAISGYTSLVIEIVKEPKIVTPVFEKAYYIGEHSEQHALLFETTIQLIQGYDESVSFTLEGDDSQWFELVQNGENSLSLRLSEDTIALIADRSHLLFSVVANKPNSFGGRAAVIISLSDFSTKIPLRFSQNHYIGSVENGHFTIDTINLEEGYTSDMEVSFTGDYVDLFQLTNDEGLFTLQLLYPLPDEITQNNVLIFTLEVQVERTRAHTTVIIELIKDEISLIAFDEAYYVGSYSNADGLTFNQQINLVGYDDSVEFNLEGENARWFGIEEIDNAVLITLVDPIPPEVYINSPHLTFIITAQNLNSMTARAAMIITLTDEKPVLRFERNSYVGSIENNEVSIEPITLNEGYSSDVSFNLLGELSTHFSISQDGQTINIILEIPIPDEILAENRLILLELQASSSQATSGYATLVLKLVREDTPLVELTFSETYYTGQYTEAEGLTFEDIIMLAEGYDDTVEFGFEGVHSQWFDPVVSGNAVSPQIEDPIPPEILINNHQLIFVVTAKRPGSTTARATIVISLIHDNTEGLVLRFERNSYVGTIENNVANLEPITLSEGYTDAVIFTLHGALAEHFDLNTVGATVTIALQSGVPGEVIPSSGSIVLELQASAPETQSAFATIVFEIVRDDSPIIELVFSEPHYTGHYTEATGLIFEAIITLTEGFDETVEFALEGGHSQWFEATASGNSATLTLIAPIPSAVIGNNHQLIFIIIARRPGGTTGTATIVISLPDEFTEGLLLGFERVSYLGTIENNVANLEPITLSEGYTDAVIFTLHGALAEHFDLNTVGATVTIALQSGVPGEVIPSSGSIVLELQASAPETQSAFATIVFEIVRDDSPIIELVFSEPHYTGHYTEATGLIFEAIITLTEGFDETVEFALEGDHSQWFEATASENSVTLTLIAPIPSAVIGNNHQLIFIIIARRPGGTTGTATIVISLPDEFTEGLLLGFERVSYLGTIENNVANLEPITLSEGYTDAVIFTLHGALAEHFDLNTVGATVTIALQSGVPGEVIPSSGSIVLELQASAPETQSAFATIVFEIVRDDSPIIELVFSEPHYTGHYTEATGLIFEAIITLTEGFDETVEFALEGGHSQWFEATASGNSVTLTLIAPIPSAVIGNNHQLIFIIIARRPGGTTGTATIVISLPDEFTEGLLLGFERVSYLGTIENNVSNLEPITLSEGYTDAVIFTLHGALAEHFDLNTVGATVTIALQSGVPGEVIPSSGSIVLELQASAPETQSAFATIVFEIVRDDSPIIELVFSEPHYTGHYTEATGLIFEAIITLTEGFDETVEFALEGDHSQWFEATASGNSVTLTLIAPIPSAVIGNNHQLIFILIARRPGGTTGIATIVISLPDEFTEGLLLGFERVSYLGTIENNVSNLEPITLSEGYTDAVIFTLHGALAEHFDLNTVGATVTIALQSGVPGEVIPSSGSIVLELQASAPETQSAFATIVFEIVRDDSPIIELVFSEPHYTGHYTEATGLIFEAIITLTEGFDETVEFALEGGHSQWFEATASGNSVTLTLISPIPSAVIGNNHQLIFIIIARRPGGTTGTATIVISLPDEFTEGLLLGFERVSYLGTIENNVSNLEPITLSEGYTDTVIFTLHGALAEHFDLNTVGATVTIALQSGVPGEVIPSSGSIVLELQASAPETQSAFATIVFEIVRDDSPIIELVFSEPHYTGHYTEATGLIFEAIITLTEGFDETVEFALEGGHSQWFEATASGNSVTLTLIAPIPSAVIGNNHQLIFIIIARRPGGTTGTATIVISLPDEFTEGLLLGFERVSYLGTIENNVSNLEPITLSEGYTDAVIFTLHGALAEHFDLNTVGATVTIALQSGVPGEVIPSSGSIVLELQASAPETQSAFATIVFEIVRDDSPIIELVFSEPHYTGHYTEATGLIFEAIITLTEGFDETVEFALEGGHSQWFEATASGNSVTLTLISPIPSAVIGNNHQLIFIIIARRPGGTTGTATIVISLPDEFTEGLLLGFERVSYLGTIENNVSNLEPITLSEGYTDTVIFTLHGALAEHFDLNTVGATVTIALQSGVPGEVIPSSGSIVLELQASAPETQSAFATIVFEIVRDDSPIIELVFSEPHYTGHYTEATGLIFEAIITLTEGFDETVEFALEGGHSQWFEATASGNSVTLTLISPIPSAVIGNNHQLIFIIIARRPGGTTGTATIVISLPDEFTEGLLLGFERVSYLGTIENNVSNLEPITLSEGYTDAVIFTLHGALAEHFDLNTVGATVTIALQSGVPGEVIPSSGSIVLELQASAPETQSAFATIVFEIVRDDSPIIELVFSEPHYTGHYTEATGLIFEAIITLTEGFDETVEFALEGGHSQWFEATASGNSVTLTLIAPIPSAVIGNNHQLIFIIIARRPGGTTGTATIVISLPDEFTEGLLLGFERVSYLGTIENNVANLEPITLSEGYTDAVIFTLHGALAEHFDLNTVGATVTIALQSGVPGEVIPSSGSIVLELQASAPETQSAFATIVFEIVRDDSPIIELVFSEPHYTGHYTEATGLIFEAIITLTEGFDETVEFALEGGHSQWFEATASENSVTLTLIAPIPSAVIGNNHQLIFIIIARRPGGTTGTATIVISLPDEFTEGLLLGFERVSYLGTIENNLSNLEPITLSEGYTDAVIFTLHGALAEHFDLNTVGATVTIALQSGVPGEVIPSSGSIVLELQASAPETQSAFATIVFEIVRDDSPITELVFSEPHYTGHYTEATGLIFEAIITLTEGFDETVEFALEGGHSQWFEATASGNSVTLTLIAPIPSAVIGNNHQLIFIIIARRPGGTTGTATIVISLPDEFTEGLLLGFERVSYLGTIENNVSNLEPITLSEGYTDAVIFTLHGALAEHFDLNTVGATVTIALQSGVPGEVIPSSGSIVLELQASAPETQSAFATIVFEIVRDDSPIIELVFSEPHYTGHYTEATGLIFEAIITLTEGFDETVEFALEGDHSQWFEATASGNSVTLTLIAPIPSAVIGNNHQLIFILIARRPGGTTGTATIVISLPDEFTEGLLLGFERVSYLGTIENNVSNLEPITLSEGYTDAVIFTLHGALAEHFDLNTVGATVTIALQSGVPGEVIPSSGSIVLELQASAPETQSAFATIVFEIVRDDSPIIELVFSEPHYTGHYTEATGLIFEAIITLTEGFDETVEFALEGGHSQWFEATASGNSVTLTLIAPIPSAVIGNNHQLIFIIIARRPGGTTGTATIVISLPDEFTEGLLLGFERVSYLGTIENNVANLEPITLIEGYTEAVFFTLHGELSYLFMVSSEDATVTISLQSIIAEQSLPSNGVIVLDLQASAPNAVRAFATIVFEIVREDPSMIELTFGQAFYIGQYSDAEGLVFEDSITLTQGYHEAVDFTLEGDHVQLFELIVSEDTVTLILVAPIPQAILESQRKLTFVISAHSPAASCQGRTIIIISLPNDSQTSPEVSFERLLFEGIIQDGVVRHELITISGYHGTDILLFGEFSDLFIGFAVGGEVDVRGRGTVVLAEDVRHVALELRAAGASAVLLLDVISTPVSDLPSVAFSSPVYSVRVDVSHTGLMARVEATADNGEPINYSLDLDDDHLLQRVSIDNEGGLHLSAPAYTGLYNFQVFATSAFTRVTGAAQVNLAVHAITVCGDDDELFMPPLLILERDEEEAHSNLVPLSEEFEGCQYHLTNRWPVDQQWLYTDANGLHTRLIDREDESIAFMALSQIQVELTLECDRDNILTRSKRSLMTSGLDWLGPYDYGNNNWILSDTILYNSRRTLVNLIVNDINDHTPIFEGDQPVIVGYPIPELEERVLPRALIELKATDKDVGLNAAIRYSSNDEVLAVSPTTGFVHVRHNIPLEDDTTLIVFATDKNGEDGRTASLELLVRLLDISHIAVVTVRNAFLENEQSILADLTAAVGYDIRVLRSTVISDVPEPESETESEELDTRKKREVSSAGATMQLYVYGLIEREPVDVDRLTADINNNAGATVNVASSISLEDYLDNLDVCSGRDTGLLAATIVLSVLLFIVIVAAAVWFFLRWRKNKKYEQFEDSNSLASQNESLGSLPKLETLVKPRLNLEELRKSEKKLQERLQAPIEEVTVVPSTSTREPPPAESVVNMSLLDPQIPQLPIVIQSIDKLKDDGGDSDEDEFGERKKNRRKSVVTFNENVEKIIHVEDDPDEGSIPDTQVYKL